MKKILLIALVIFLSSCIHFERLTCKETSVKYAKAYHEETGLPVKIVTGWVYGSIGVPQGGFHDPIHTFFYYHAAPMGVVRIQNIYYWDYLEQVGNFIPDDKEYTIKQFLER